ncbi:MAG: hypothetical protein JXA60_04860 [Candidatus Coatesbacteria bacterium]|nr:hypothetical protein [Candidatus Coatesbacteria bacterium]
MPGFNGTGSSKQGQGRGKGMGRKGNRGRNSANLSQVSMNDFCICPNPACREKIPHQAGIPCTEMKCPKCGAQMIRG